MEYTVSSGTSEAAIRAACKTGGSTAVLRLEHDAVDLHVRMAYAARFALGHANVLPGGSLVALCFYVASSGGKRFCEGGSAGDEDNAGVAYCHIRVPPEYQLRASEV
jgi:hypothetical protein